VIFGKTNTEAVNLANISKVENTAAHTIDFPPLISPAEETEWPLRSQAFLPLITKPPVPAAMLDKSTA
jgi:hypothetical protein